MAASLLHTVIQGLAHDSNAVRIKKLLLYACRHRWESNISVLDAVLLTELVEELWAIAPTFDQLQVYLDRVTHTLNKTVEYTLIANSIQAHLKPLYCEALTQVNSYASHYQAIATQLEQERESLRIKKLLFCACQGTWENNIEQLNAVSFLHLVQQLHQLTRTDENLQAILASIVKTLNRQAEYTAIAQTIIHDFQPLYDDLEHTQVLTRYADQTAPLAVLPHHHQGTEITPTAVALPEPATQPIDWFDLRLEIIKYTSPLRAKMLLVALIHHPIDEDTAWEWVKNQELDPLLKQVFQLSLSLTTLKEQLVAIAHAFTEPDQYLQAASAIIRAIQPYQLGNTSVPSPSATAQPDSAATRSRPNAMPTSPAADLDEDVTCQLFVAPVEIDPTRSLPPTQVPAPYLPLDQEHTAQWIAEPIPVMPDQETTGIMLSVPLLHPHPGDTPATVPDVSCAAPPDQSDQALLLSIQTIFNERPSTQNQEIL